MRPSTLKTYIGQEHLVGEGAVLRASIAQNKLPSMILWGPPGVGKTTLALLLANELKRPYFALSAINSGVKDVRDTIKKAEQQQFFDSPSPILFIDEIHRFSKSQQDSLLAAVERGTVILIGATTENPSFEVISALLSRCQDTISAFIKSVRGSDPNAAVYYLARMIAGGEDPIFICRRLVILASEDIGLANPNALLIANACFDAVKKIGLPEGRIPMSQATIYLATSPKSNTAYVAINEALAKVRETGNLSIPMHLRNAPTSLMKEIGYGDGYIYTHNQKPSDPEYHYLPKDIKNEVFYHPKAIGAEKKIVESLLPKKEN
ncbi:UNVERIFIED_CONTAM: hypothetical protein GTU68_049813 [Idotea baltica]|nr:hypothetical protein [Idotea baltica]